MKSRPIIMRAEEVRAILDGRKTQFRRPIKPNPIPFGTDARPWMPVGGVHQDRWLCPHGQPGDRLWVRETWMIGTMLGMHRGQERPIAIYRADGEIPFPWRPSIHMPRWASRITLEIVRVRVERVQDITEEDATAEGVLDGGCLTCGIPEPCVCKDPKPNRRDSFVGIWQSIHGTWEANPWVWVVEFRKVTK